MGHWQLAGFGKTSAVLLLDSPACDVCRQVADTTCWIIQHQWWRRNLKGGTVMEVFSGCPLIDACPKAQL